MAYNNYGGLLLDGEPPKNEIKPFPNDMNCSQEPPAGLTLSLIGRYDKGMEPDGGLLFALACPAGYKIQTAEMAPKEGNNDTGYATYDAPVDVNPAQRSPEVCYFQVRFKIHDLDQDDFESTVTVSGSNNYIYTFKKKRTGGGLDVEEVIVEVEEEPVLSAIQGNTRLGADAINDLNAFPTEVTVSPEAPEGMNAQVLGWKANTVENMRGVVMQFTAPAGKAIQTNETGSGTGADGRTYVYMMAVVTDAREDLPNTVYWEVWYLKTDAESSGWSTQVKMVSGSNNYIYTFKKKRTGGGLDL